MTDRIPLTYCSFADDFRCRGVLILEGALSPVEAARRAWELGLNPGGQLLCGVYPEELPEKEYLRGFENRNRLLSPTEARDLLGGKSVREVEEQGEHLEG